MSRLYIKTALNYNKTVIEDSFFTSPLKIAKPFIYDKYTEIMIMQASAGVLENDVYDMEFDMGIGTNTLITGQSYTKLFKMDGGKAVQKIKINVAENASLSYFPCPVIPFENSDFTSVNEIYLTKSSRFSVCDVFACGRIAMGERDKFRKYHSKITVYIDNVPIFTDNTMLIPEQMNLSSIGFFEGYTHQGMFYEYGIESKSEQLTHPDGMEIAVTDLKQGRLTRILGNSSDEIMQYINKNSVGIYSV